ncbi:MAG: hypothetical protein AAGL49_08270 [Pseudomonadota bacterium]
MQADESDEARRALEAALAWHADMGVEECVSPLPVGAYAWAEARRTAAVQRARPEPATVTPVRRRGEALASADEAARAAAEAAARCETVEALAKAVAEFEGCGLKAGARTTVFADNH